MKVKRNAGKRKIYGFLSEASFNFCFPLPQFPVSNKGLKENLQGQMTYKEKINPMN